MAGPLPPTVRGDITCGTVPGAGRVRSCSVPGVLQLWRTSEPPVGPSEALALRGPALKTHKDQAVYWLECFAFIHQCLQSLSSKGMLLFIPVLRYKRCCKSGASPNPCSLEASRKKGMSEGRRKGRFGLPLVKLDWSGLHLLARAVQLDVSPGDAGTKGLAWVLRLCSSGQVRWQGSAALVNMRNGILQPREKPPLPPLFHWKS